MGLLLDVSILSSSPVIFRIASPCWIPNAALFPPTPRRNNPRKSGTFAPMTFRSSGYDKNDVKFGYGRARMRYRTAMFAGRFSVEVGTTLAAEKNGSLPSTGSPGNIEPKSPENPALALADLLVNAPPYCGPVKRI